MDTKQFSDLRKRVEMTQALVAEALGVTSRTISAWETANPIRDLSRPEAKAIRDLFRGPLLENHLWDLCGQAFDLIPSEMVSIWLFRLSFKSKITQIS
jgi:DNA-binding XRE family transcriptional regulator